MSKIYSVEQDNSYYRGVVCLEIRGEHIDEPDKCFLCYERKVWEEFENGEIKHIGYEPICLLNEPIDNINVSLHFINSSKIIDIKENNKHIWIAK